MKPEILFPLTGEIALQRARPKTWQECLKKAQAMEEEGFEQAAQYWREEAAWKGAR